MTFECYIYVLQMLQVSLIIQRIVCLVFLYLFIYNFFTLQLNLNRVD